MKSTGLSTFSPSARDRSYATVVGGPTALSPKQVLSSSICYVLGIIIYILLTTAILVWFQVPTVLIGVILVLYALYWGGKLRRSKALTMKVTQSINHYKQLLTRETANSLTNVKDHALISKWESYALTLPRDSFIVTYLIAQVFIFFAIPLVFLSTSKNLPGAVVFIFMAWMSFQRRFLNGDTLLEALGSLGSLGKRQGSVLKFGGLLGVTSRQEWKYKSRLFHIQSMSDNASQRIWKRALGSFLWLFVVVAVAAWANNGNETEQTKSSKDTILDPRMKFPSNSSYFYQEQQPAVHPTCRLDSASDSTSSVQHLADFAFLSSILYSRSEPLQPLLDTWFGKEEAIHVESAQLDFREIFPDFSHSTVSYELVTFPTDSTAVVVVRGTRTFFDYFEDGKIWYSSALFQVFREALPLGRLINPLIRFNAGMLSLLETATIKKTAYYRETTKFIEHLKDSGKYNNILITGHSLGGGLALISGAQTQTKAVGVSAPNTVIGRDTVTPKISLDDLNKFTFNIVPERDIFPKIGDQLNVEKIKCRADVKDSFNCHNDQRTICEILYICGFATPRPVFCECSTKYGYPMPTNGQTNDFMADCL